MDHRQKLLHTPDLHHQDLTELVTHPFASPSRRSYCLFPVLTGSLAHLLTWQVRLLVPRKT